MKKERSSFRASGIAIRSIIAAAALAVLVLSAVLIRGGFDAFRQSDITAAGTGYTVPTAWAAVCLMSFRARMSAIPLIFPSEVCLRYSPATLRPKTAE